MRRDSDHQPNPERLPADFGSALRKTDDRLADLARLAKSRIDDGLADGVYEASVKELPVSSPSERRAKPARPEWRPRLAGTRRDWRMVATGWGRLGLAAALGLAFVVAGILMDGSAEQPVGELMALDIEWLDEDPLEMVDAQVAHILDTVSLRSPAEITGEMESMIAALEM